jgi:hypothetical protein
MTVAGKGEEKNLISINSSKKDSREEVVKEREESKKRILDEIHISLKILLNLCYHYQ